MRHIALFFGMVAVLAVSCSVKEESFTEAKQGDVVFYASFEKPFEGTRVYANENLHLRWTADDRVSIFDKRTYNQEYKFTGETGDNTGGFDKVGGSEFMTGNKISDVVSVYPYQSTTKITESEVVTVDLPSKQTYAKNTFGLGANTMVSVTADNFLQYKNVGGYLMLKLFGEEVSVSSITLKGNNGEKIAGKATITMSKNGTPTVSMTNDATDEITLVCDTPVTLNATAEESTAFWFVVPPVKFKKGFQITVAGNGGIFEKSTDKSITIDRNNLSKMAPIEILISSAVQVSFKMVFPVLSPDDELAALPESVSDYSYGIRIQQYNSNTASYEPYAVGVFDDLSKAEITMNPSHKYIVEAAAINHFYSNDNEFQGASGMLPFVTNSFIMDSGVSLKEWLFHNVWSDAYYGKIINYSPLTSGQCNINLQNESAGIKIEVNGTNKGSVKFSFNQGFTRPITFSLSEQTSLSSYLAFDTWFGESQNNHEIGCTVEYIDEDNASTTIIDDSFSFNKGQVTIIPVEIEENESTVPVPKAVDLGLSVKWASFNLGASKPEESGDYYAWGETEPYYSSLDPLVWRDGMESGYYWESYRWCMEGDYLSLTKYCNDSYNGHDGFTDGKTGLDLEDDTAHVLLGGNWRMPTDAEWTELMDNCIWTQAEENGVSGGKVTSNINGNSIFLPVAGWFNETKFKNGGSYGYYWSSSLDESDPNFAWHLSLYYRFNVSKKHSYRDMGFSIRPVYAE